MEWQGKWIAPRAFATVIPIETKGEDAPENLQNRHFWFAKTFMVQKDADPNWILRVSADDYYKLYVNDHFVCQGPAPSYLFRYAWNETDISLWLQNGENRISLHVYSQGLYNRVWMSADGRCGCIAELHHAGRCVIATGEDWTVQEDTRYLPSPTVGYRTAFLENYDAEIVLPPPEPAVVLTNPVYSMEKNSTPLLEFENLTPIWEKLLLPIADERPFGGMLYDFGREIAAHLHLLLYGKKGDILRIRCGEELLDPVDGDADTQMANSGVRYQMRCNCTYEEVIHLGDGALELVQYDYKAFRYVEIEPLAGKPAWKLSADARHAPFDDTYCVLETNDPVLSAVFSICKEGVKVGSQEVYVDCPHREKGQYAGDLTVTTHSSLWLTGNATMLKRAIRAQLDSARFFPGILAVAPGALEQKIADYSLQLPLLLHRYYSYTKDRAFLEEAMPVLENMLVYFASFTIPQGKRGAGLLTNLDTMWNLVDWPANLRDGYAFKLEPIPEDGPHAVLNAFWAGCLAVYEALCAILSSAPVAVPRAGAVRDAFNEAFFDTENACYHDSRDTDHSACQSNIIPLYFALYPAEYKEAFVSHVLQQGIRSGVYMTYFLLHGLCRAGHPLDAYQILTSTGAASWYNMVREGATTCYEAWGKEQKWNTSLCHPWASAPVSVLIEGILGYRLDGSRTAPVLPAGIQAEIRWGK